MSRWNWHLDMNRAATSMHTLTSNVFEFRTLSLSCAGYVVAFSAFNLGGRLMWANLSDTIGQRNTFHIFGAAGIPMFLAIPMCTQVRACVCACTAEFF